MCLNSRTVLKDLNVPLALVPGELSYEGRQPSRYLEKIPDLLLAVGIKVMLVVNTWTRYGLSNGAVINHNKVFGKYAGCTL